MNSLTLSRTRDNGAGSLENPSGNSPAPQDINNVDAECALSGYPVTFTCTPVAQAQLGVRLTF